MCIVYRTNQNEIKSSTLDESIFIKYWHLFPLPQLDFDLPCVSFINPVLKNV